jgi:hypothetical protein
MVFDKVSDPKNLLSFKQKKMNENLNAYRSNNLRQPLSAITFLFDQIQDDW